MYRLLIKIDPIENCGFEFNYILLKNFREVKRYSKLLDEAVPSHRAVKVKTSFNLSVKELYCELHSLIKEFTPVICFWGNDKKLWNQIVDAVSTINRFSKLKAPHNWVGLFTSSVKMSTLLTSYYKISHNELWDFLVGTLLNATTPDVLLCAYNKFLSKFLIRFKSYPLVYG